MIYEVYNLQVTYFRETINSPPGGLNVGMFNRIFYLPRRGTVGVGAVLII